MNKLIGITGGMASGKTTLSKKIIDSNPNYIYVNVDDFRRSLYTNETYIEELKQVIPELSNYSHIDSNILNKYIYNDINKMNSYKEILYKYLFNYLNSFNDKTILVDWALILNDNIQDKFDFIIYVDASDEVRLKRLGDSDLPKEEVLRRFELQRISNLKKYVSNKFMIIDNNDDIEFNSDLDCKFTLPNNEGKAIWEITHQCNYNCSYCIFSCNGKKINGELTTKECFKVIDELVNHNFKHLKITGGEPFIREDMLEILKYASDKLVTDISTNASLLDEKKVKLLNELKLKMIHVSLDGNRLQHESVRGNNTFDRTIRGLEILKSSINKIRIGSVIHVNNENNLEELILLSSEFKADEIIFSIMEPVSGQDRSLIKTIPNMNLIEDLEILKEKYADRIIVNYNFGKQPNYIHRCPAGDKFIYINNFGQISPCPWVYENNKACISSYSLKEKSLDELLHEKNLVKFLDAKQKGKCYGKI